MGTTLIRLQHVAGDLFLATTIDEGLKPEHPIVIPPPGGGDGGAHPEHPIVIPPTKPGEPTITWAYVEGEGWYRKIGPVDKPRPLPPGFEGEGGKWVMESGGYYYVSGPYDKPKPPGPIPPDKPPIPVPPDVEYGWVYHVDGWYFEIGPFDKPKPIGGGGGTTPPETQGRRR